MKEKISMIIFVLVLGTILTAALVGVNHYTTPIIKKNKEIKIKTSVLDALNISFAKDDIENIFSENVKTIEREREIFYISKHKETAFEITGPGLWGSISGVIALMPDLETIKGITIVHQEETPGLGGRIAEKEYLSKFKNKKVMPKLRIVSPSKKAEKENEVDGITGATMTGKAFEELINNQIQEKLVFIRGNRK